jgi:hypothetical protein
VQQPANFDGLSHPSCSRRMRAAWARSARPTVQQMLLHFVECALDRQTTSVGYQESKRPNTRRVLSSPNRSMAENVPSLSSTKGAVQLCQIPLCAISGARPLLRIKHRSNSCGCLLESRHYQGRSV